MGVTLLHGSHLVVDLRTTQVRQLVNLEVTALVGLDTRHRFTIIHSGHLDVGGTRAVVEAHIALHAARMLTLANLDIGLGGADALAVVHAKHLIFIPEQRRHAGVLVAHLVDVGGYLLPVAVAAALGTAHHLEVVDGASVGVPRQQHTALARLRQQHLVNRTRVLVVEVGQGRLGDGGILRLIHCHNSGYKVVALYLPAVGEVFQDLFHGGFVHDGHHDGNRLAVDNRPGVLA